MRATYTSLLSVVLLLSACGEYQGPGRPAAGFTPATRPDATGLIGNDARGLLRMFGKPRLDIRDPSSRKLQFGNARCVLDAYLYPPGKDREPLVTYVEARSRQGVPVDTNACAATLRAAQ